MQADLLDSVFINRFLPEIPKGCVI